MMGKKLKKLLFFCYKKGILHIEGTDSIDEVIKELDTEIFNKGRKANEKIFNKK